MKSSMKPGGSQQPLQPTIKKTSHLDGGSSSRQINRASCLRNRNNKEKEESKLESPLMSPFASRRNSSDEKDVIVFPSSASAFVSPPCDKLKRKKSSILKSGSSSLESSPKGSLKKLTNSKQDKRMTLVVDETRFNVEKNLFSSQPDTMLAKMFSPAYVDDHGITKPNEKGEYEINVPISSSIFKAILEYYTEGVVRCPPCVSIGQLRSACEYFIIPFSTKTIKSFNLGSLMHEISNDGAQERFAGFLEELIVPVMVKVAQKGDRECHIVVLTEEDAVEWDPSYPPMVGEEYTETVKSTQLHRFFKYIENREVAKCVLKERGMKKIKLGIEGYPLCLDQLKLRSSGRREVIYDFVQRSFLHVSWEKEESRSRHVDFQCVNKSKSITNLAAAAADTPNDHQLIEAEALEANLVRMQDELEQLEVEE